MLHIMHASPAIGGNLVVRGVGVSSHRPTPIDEITVLQMRCNAAWEACSSGRQHASNAPAGAAACQLLPVVMCCRCTWCIYCTLPAHKTEIQVARPLIASHYRRGDQ